MMDMVPQAREDLWQSIANADFRKYQEVMHSLPLKTPESLERVPVRVFMRINSSGDTRGSSYLSSYETITQTSRPLPAVTADDQPMTLREGLAPLITKWVAFYGGDNKIQKSGTAAATG